MTRRITIVAAVLALAVMAAAALSGCDSEGGGPRPPVSKSAGVSARPSATSSTDPMSGEFWGLDSSSQVYDAQLGGIYQIVGLGAFESGGVRLSWVAGGDGAGASPTVRLKAAPGVLDVWLSDMRPHVDLMAPVAVAGGPIAKIAFVTPADDSLIILRTTLRDSSTTPKAAVDVFGGDQGAGVIDVVLHD